MSCTFRMRHTIKINCYPNVMNTVIVAFYLNYADVNLPTWVTLQIWDTYWCKYVCTMNASNIKKVVKRSNIFVFWLVKLTNGNQRKKSSISSCFDSNTYEMFQFFFSCDKNIEVVCSWWQTCLNSIIYYGTCIKSPINMIVNFIMGYKRNTT